MQLISNGFNIPNVLMQAHEEGQVAGLPDFGGLVDEIYKKLGTQQTDTEKEFWECSLKDSFCYQRSKFCKIR